MLQEIVLRNLDYILTVSAQAFIGTSLDILVDLERLLDVKSSEPWSSRRLPTPTATLPAIINSEEEDEQSESPRTRDDGIRRPTFKKGIEQRLDGFLQSHDATAEGISKQIRTLRKKLQQIELLEEKQLKGHLLDDQQIAKLQMRLVLETSLAELGAPVETVPSKDCSPVDERCSRRGGSKKQRRKSKQKLVSMEEEERNTFAANAESGILKGFVDAEVREDMNKVRLKVLSSIFCF